MKIHIFGSCSGTEPRAGTHHLSFAVDRADGLYWFDAGECCSHTAHVMGVDLTRVKKVCISHTHMDHVGGLGNLFWTIRKLHSTLKKPVRHPVIDLFIPRIASWEGIFQTLRYTEGGFATNFEIDAREYGDGLLFSDGDITVTALHNNHLPHSEGEPWRSFGFLIEADGRRVIFSGDTKGLEDIYPLFPCDLLLMETGHHDPLAVAEELRGRDFGGRLCFLHHGRAILRDSAGVAAELERILPGRTMILRDAQTIEI